MIAQTRDSASDSAFEENAEPPPPLCGGGETLNLHSTNPRPPRRLVQSLIVLHRVPHPPHSRKLLMEIFEIGQVVRLKSGSPKMTIKGPDGDAADAIWAVQWIDRNGKLQGDSFHEDMLDIFVKTERPATNRDPNRDPRFR